MAGREEASTTNGDPSERRISVNLLLREHLASLVFGSVRRTLISLLLIVLLPILLFDLAHYYARFDGAAPVQDLLGQLGLDVLVAAAALLIAMGVGRRITVPLRRLREQALALGRGELGRRTSISGPGELGDLGNALNRMAEEIQAREEELRRAEQELRGRADAVEKSEVKYRSLVDNIPDVVWRADENGNAVFISPNVERLDGYTPKETCEEGGGGWLARVHPEDAGLVKAAYSHLFANGIIYDVEYRLQRKDGNWIWVHDEATAVMEIDGVPYADGVLSDVTERRRLLDRLREANEKLFAASTEAKEQAKKALKHEVQVEGYISLISHDLRTPLTAVLGHAQALVVSLENAGLGRAKRSAEDIVTAARRMNTMVQDLVDSARLESGQLTLHRQPVSLASFVCDLLERCAPIMDVGRVKVDVPSEIPPAKADQDRLERVFVNLLTNALKYSASDSEVLVKAEMAGEEVVASVADRGVGISPEDLPHIFERFYRTRGGRRPGGIGLGLYICQGLIEAHGGCIWIESRPGAGTTVFFTLPLA